MTLDYKEYKQIEQLLLLLDGFAVCMYHDYSLMTAEGRRKTYDQQLAATRALREITGLNAHKVKIEEELKQEELRLIEKHKNDIEEFTSIVSQELTAIKNPVCFREYTLNKDATSAEELFKISIDCTPEPPIEEPTYPNTTKEEWLVAIEKAKTRFQEEYEDAKGYNDPNSENNKTFTKAFGLPHNHFFPPVALKEVFVDEEILNITKGFMSGPVGIFCNKAVEAGLVQKYDTLNEMKIFLELQAKTKDIVIYLTYKEGNKYCFRGAFVDKIL